MRERLTKISPQSLFYGSLFFLFVNNEDYRKNYTNVFFRIRRKNDTELLYKKCKGYFFVEISTPRKTSNFELEQKKVFSKTFPSICTNINIYYVDYDFA